MQTNEFKRVRKGYWKSPLGDLHRYASYFFFLLYYDEPNGTRWVVNGGVPSVPVAVYPKKPQYPQYAERLREDGLIAVHYANAAKVAEYQLSQIAEMFNDDGIKPTLQRLNARILPADRAPFGSRRKRGLQGKDAAPFVSPFAQPKENVA